MELDDRKIMILNAVIKNYMETGEPVGSRTISKLPGCSLSSATIRNEMCDLEEMGYLIQPHTSAGRIPSDRGYRFYVDEILKETDNEVQALKRQFVARVDRLESVLRRMARIAADNTNYAAVISGPSTSRAPIKLLQLSKVDENRLLVVLVLEGNLISNRILSLNRELAEAELLQLNILLNTRLSGVCLQDAEDEILKRLLLDAGESRELVAYLLTELRRIGIGIPHRRLFERSRHECGNDAPDRAADEALIEGVLLGERGKCRLVLCKHGDDEFFLRRLAQLLQHGEVLAR